jgi:hypothetical protein
MLKDDILGQRARRAMEAWIPDHVRDDGREGIVAEPRHGFTPRHEGRMVTMTLGLRDLRPFVPSCEKLTLNANSAPRKPHSLMKRRFRGF